MGFWMSFGFGLIPALFGAYIMAVVAGALDLYPLLVAAGIFIPVGAAIWALGAQVLGRGTSA